MPRSPFDLSTYTFKDESEKKRFESFIEKTDEGCWLWTGAKDYRGYSRFWLRGNVLYAHRIMLANTKGIQEGQVTRHQCNCKSCVCPDHLVAGSNRENSLDYFKQATRKLNARDAAAIRDLYDDGVPRKVIAEHYDVAISTINDVISGRCWNHAD